MTELEEIKKDVKEILKILNGNGKMGLVAKLAILWSTMIFLLSTGVAVLLWFVVPMVIKAIARSC